MLRTAQSLPLQGLSTLGFDAGVSPDAASLLPGLLAATRTGLPPAGDDELTTTDHLLMATSCLLGARNAEARRYEVTARGDRGVAGRGLTHTDSVGYRVGAACSAYPTCVGGPGVL